MARRCGTRSARNLPPELQPWDRTRYGRWRCTCGTVGFVEKRLTPDQTRIATHAALVEHRRQAGCDAADQGATGDTAQAVSV